MSNSQKNQTLELEWRVCQGPLSYRFLRNFSSDVEESLSEINNNINFVVYTTEIAQQLQEEIISTVELGNKELFGRPKIFP